MSPGETETLPPACGVAFKEWHGVCEALAGGRQSLILRKGGIEEGPGGFVPDHHAFWLYPTGVHQAQQGLKPEARVPPGPGAGPPERTVALGSLAVVGLVGRVEREESLEALDGLHVWTPETVARRFQYRRPGLWVLGVRVFRREDPVEVNVTAEHAGCKTWVPLGVELPTRGLTPVMTGGAFEAAMSRLRGLLEFPATA